MSESSSNRGSAATLPGPPRVPHVVIVGAGFGGLAAARALSKAPVEVTVLDRENYHLFQPLLYQVATAALSPGHIAAPIRSLLRRKQNVRVRWGEAKAVDLARREVQLAHGDALSYDYLVLAAGARHAYFGHPEWEAHAPGLKSLEDALDIRRRILSAFERAEEERDAQQRNALLTFVVVGAGPTGVELAGAIAEIARHTVAKDFRSIDPRTARVLLIEAGPRVLSAFSPGLSERAQRSLVRAGVEVKTGGAVQDITAEGVRLAEDWIPCRTVLWAAGVQAAPLGASLGVPLDNAGRIKVEPDLSISGHPEAFVIGDLASFAHQTGKPLPGLAPVAMQMGQYVGRVLRQRLAQRPAQPFRYVDRGTMATIGRAAGIAQMGGLQLTGLVGWLAWLFVHLLLLIDFRSRLLVLFEWAWLYFTFKRGARLITRR